MTIRAATEQDLPAILEITNDAIMNSTALWSLTPVDLAARLAWMRERVGDGFPVLVAEHDGRVAGYASYGRFRPHEGYLHTVEHSLYVHPAARGQRIGTALLDALLADATASGRHVMIGGIEATNRVSIALHERAGFTPAAVLHQVGHKFGRWLDLLFVQKLIPSVPEEAPR
nr:N-acetyltransferase family protein [uncultured Lichenicoccus sp.]